MLDIVVLELMALILVLDLTMMIKLIYHILNKVNDLLVFGLIL